MKVLHVLWDLGQGGAQTYVLDLVRQHLALREIVTEVLALSSTGTLSNEIRKLGIPVKSIGMKNGYDLVKILKLRKYLETTHADIIHSHSQNFAFTWLISRTQIPKVYTEHGGNLLGRRLQSRLTHKLFGHNYHRIIAISEHMAQVLRNSNSRIADKLYVVHNGTDVEKVDASVPIERDALPRNLMQPRSRVGIIGRLVAQKGIDTFLETAAIIARKRDNVSFPIVGEGPLRSELLAKAVRLGIEKRVFFLGFRADAIRILKTFDVFLFTSNYEPFGLVLTEAMAARIPVVALNLIGAVGEIIDDKLEGFLVDRKDPELLANRVIRLLDDADLRDYLAKNARSKVEQHFTIKQNAKKILDIYRECTNDK